MSTSLIAVFIPILLMGGVVGRLFREFAVTLSIAIAVRCLFADNNAGNVRKVFEIHERSSSWQLYRASEATFDWILGLYAGGLRWVLRHQFPVLILTLATIATSISLYIIVPKGFFPDQDTGRLNGNVQAAQDISFQEMRTKLTQVVGIILSDPAIDTVGAFTGGGGTTNTARMFVSLKPLNERKVSATDVVNRLRPKLARVPGAATFLRPVQDVSVGGRQSNAQFQYTLQGDNFRRSVQICAADAGKAEG